MAGEWLKFDSTLPEKQETLAITVAMGWDDPDLTVGKLMRLFRWFDQHTLDGNARSVTPALLDRIVGVSGFVTAVAEQGWLVIVDGGISLHNFERHNGATAKSRALTAKRVANHRGGSDGSGPGNAPTVTPALAREEKRREEKKQGERRASRIPPNFEPQPEPEAEQGIDRQTELANFRDYWTAKSGREATKLDWQATWRTWARKSHRKPGDLRAVTVPASPHADAALKKLDADRVLTKPPSLETLAQLAALRQGAH